MQQGAEGEPGEAGETGIRGPNVSSQTEKITQQHNHRILITNS